MDTANLKLELIKAISESDDISLLKEIKNLVAHNQSNESVYVLNDWQQERINIALKQVENGEVITDEEAQIELEKWFEEEEKQFGQ